MLHIYRDPSIALHSLTTASLVTVTSPSLQVFPPTPPFEDYVEKWVRENPSQANKHNITGLLRRRVFEGAKTWEPLAASSAIEEVGAVKGR